MGAYTVSLLKAWWGDARDAPRTTSASTTCRGSPATTPIYQTVLGMLDGSVKGFIVVGQNPAVGSANSGLHRRAMANLDWLVVRDFVEIETAAFWYDSPEVESGELDPDGIGTEVFFLPAAAHTEKDGSFTNTQRLLQWHHKAVEPPGDCRSELWFYYHLGRLIREKLADSRRSATGRCWSSPGTTRRPARSPTRAPRRCCARSTAGTGTARRCPRTSS